MTTTVATFCQHCTVPTEHGADTCAFCRDYDPIRHAVDSRTRPCCGVIGGHASSCPNNGPCGHRCGHGHVCTLNEGHDGAHEHEAADGFGSEHVWTAAQCVGSADDADTVARHAAALAAVDQLPPRTVAATADSELTRILDQALDHADSATFFCGWGSAALYGDRRALADLAIHQLRAAMLTIGQLRASQP